MGMFKFCVLLCVAGAAVGDKPPTGIQPHHIKGQGGYDSFGQIHASSPVYDSKGKGYAAPVAPAIPYGHSQGDIPHVYYKIERPKPEKESKGFFKDLESKMKEYSDKFSKFVKGATGYDYDYAPDYSYGPPTQSYGPPADSYGPPLDTYGPPADSYGPPPADTYGPPVDTYGPPLEYEYVYEEEKDKGLGAKMKEYYDKFVKDMYSWQDKSAKKIKEMFGYGDYDYEEVIEYAPPAPDHGYGAPAPAYGPPVAPAPAYGAPVPHYQEHEVVFQPISRPKPEKGFFSKAPKAPKRRPIKKPAPGPVYAPPQPTYPRQPTYHAPQPTYHEPQPTYHAPQQPTYVAPAPTYDAPSSEYGPPKTHDITHVKAAPVHVKAAPVHIKAAPVKAKGGHVHHKAPAPSVGVSSYTSH